MAEPVVPQHTASLSRSRPAGSDWQQQMALYQCFTSAELRRLYRLRLQWIREQANRQEQLLRPLEFVRYLVKQGRLSG